MYTTFSTDLVEILTPSDAQALVSVCVCVCESNKWCKLNLQIVFPCLRTVNSIHSIFLYVD